MIPVIDKLQTQHERILDLLEKVKQIGYLSPEALAFLRSARALLLDHLRKEDIDLYPPLKAAAHANPAIKETLEAFATGMDEISVLANNFFKKCQDPSAGKELSAEFGILSAKLRARIRREEDILYPLYEEVTRASVA